jgi:hypothetical protein
MNKKVTFAAKPTAKPAASADNWVENRVTNETPANPETVDMKRLTFDIPEPLHRRIKTHCASQGLKMTDELRLLLEKHFPEQSSQA